MTTTEDEKTGAGLSLVPEKPVVVPTTSIQPNSEGLYECPECAALHADTPGQFNRTLAKSRGSLGKHRATAHRVPGVARATKREKTAKQHKQGTKASKIEFDSKKMLVYLYPNGIPADPAVMQDTLDWLEQGRILFNQTMKYRKS